MEAEEDQNADQHEGASGNVLGEKTYDQIFDEDEDCDDDEDSGSLKDFIEDDQGQDSAYSTEPVTQILSQPYKTWPTDQKQMMLRALNCYVDEPGLADALKASTLSSASNCILSPLQLGPTHRAMCESFMQDINVFCVHTDMTFWENAITLLGVQEGYTVNSLSADMASLSSPSKKKRPPSSLPGTPVKNKKPLRQSTPEQTGEQSLQLLTADVTAGESLPGDDSGNASAPSSDNSLQQEASPRSPFKNNRPVASQAATPVRNTKPLRQSTPEQTCHDPFTANDSATGEDSGNASAAPLCDTSLQQLTDSSTNDISAIDSTQQSTTADLDESENAEVAEDFNVMIRNPSGDIRDQQLVFAERTHIKRGSFPNCKYKQYLYVTPGDTLPQNTEKQQALEEKLPVGTMISMCSEQSLSQNTGIFVTLVVLRTIKPASCADIAQNIGSALSLSAEMANMSMLVPLSTLGYQAYYAHIHKSQTKTECGEIDDMTQKRLNLAAPEVEDAFMKLCDYAERNQCKPDATALCFLFETMPHTAPEYKALKKVTQSAGAFKSFIDTCKWMLIQRSMYCCQDFADPAMQAKCKVWEALFKDFKGYIDSENLPEYWPPERDENDHIRCWWKYNVLNSQTDIERILIANRIAPTNFANAVINACVHGYRRERSLLLYSEKHKCGKSLIANALKMLFHGKRITLEERGSRDFIVSSASHAGVVVIEDPSEQALNYMVRCLRPHLDGDEVPVNNKHQQVYSATYPPIVITTNTKNTTDALESRSKSFVFCKTMDEVFQTRRVESISGEQMACFLGKYVSLPQCNAIYNGLTPLTSDTIYTQCVYDAPLGHSPYCKFMVMFTRLADKVQCPDRVIQTQQGPRKIPCIERITPANCGVFLTKKVLSTAQLYMLHKECCLVRGDTTGTKVKREKASEALQITAFFENVAVPFSAVFEQLLSEYDNDFWDKPCRDRCAYISDVSSVTSKDYYSVPVGPDEPASADLGPGEEQRVGLNNLMTRHELQMREGRSTADRQRYHRHVIDKLLTFAERHMYIGTRDANGSFATPQNFSLLKLYEDCTGGTLLRHALRDSYEEARLPEDLFG